MKYQVVVEGRTFEIEIDAEGKVWVDRQPFDVDLEGIDGLPQYSLLVDHRSYETHVETEEAGECQVMVAGRTYQACLQSEPTPSSEPARYPPPSPAGSDRVCAPLPGLLAEVRVVEGEAVGQGQVVAVLESMKMRLELRTSCAGAVQRVCAAPGVEVAQGELLLVIGQE
ncbi:MAG: hypothetical protein JW900_14710 [Anaerolineae bacterium]|nr:hypothetical protein [Anaerolineae bacterium]